MSMPPTASLDSFVVPGGLLAIALLARARRRAQSSAEIPSEERVKSDMNA